MHLISVATFVFWQGTLYLPAYNVAVRQPANHAIAVADLGGTGHAVVRAAKTLTEGRGGTYFVAHGAADDAPKVPATSWADLDWGYPGTNRYIPRRAWNGPSEFCRACTLHFHGDGRCSFLRRSALLFAQDGSRI